jgi:phospholipase/carboxylesterase
MKPIRTRLGGLDTLLLEPSDRSAIVANVLLSHGFGAPGEDLVGLAAELTHAAPVLAPKVRWVFPVAPLSLAELGMPTGRAWWHLDMERLVMGRDWKTYSEEVPEGLPKARRMYLALLDALQAQTKLPISRTVLGGFSQGAMLSTDVALRLEEAPLGLVILSGALVSRAAWAERAPKRAGLPVFQSHGRQDPILPFEVAEQLRALLEEAKLDVRFESFHGPHTIVHPVLESLAAWLSARVP